MIHQGVDLSNVERSWLPPLAVRQRERREAAQAAYWRQRDRAAEQLRHVADDRRAAPVHGHMRDAELCELAQRRADLMGDLIAEQGTQTPEALRAWLDAEVWHLGWYEFDEAASLAGIIARVQDPVWWRRRLRRIAVRLR